MNTLNNAINDYLGYSYNLYKRLHAIYKDITKSLVNLSILIVTKIQCWLKH